MGETTLAETQRIATIIIQAKNVTLKSFIAMSQRSQHIWSWKTTAKVRCLLSWFQNIRMYKCDTLHVIWRDSITGKSSNKQCNGQENGTPCIKNCRHPDCKKVITSFHNLFNLYSQDRTEKLEKKKTWSTFKRIWHPTRQFKHSLWCLLSSP